MGKYKMRRKLVKRCRFLLIYFVISKKTFTFVESRGPLTLLRPFRRLHASVKPLPETLKRLQESVKPPLETMGRLRESLKPLPETKRRLRESLKPPPETIERFHASVKTPQAFSWRFTCPLVPV